MSNLHISRFSDTVALHARERFYSFLLAALQSAVGAFDCTFVQRGEGEADLAPSHHLLLPQVARRLARARHSFLAPGQSNEQLERRVDQDMADGSAVACLRELLDGLRVAGVILRPGKDTRRLVAVAAADANSLRAVPSSRPETCCGTGTP